MIVTKENQRELEEIRTRGDRERARESYREEIELFGQLNDKLTERLLKLVPKSLL